MSIMSILTTLLLDIYPSIFECCTTQQNHVWQQYHVLYFELHKLLFVALSSLTMTTNTFASKKSPLERQFPSTISIQSTAIQLAQIGLFYENYRNRTSKAHTVP